RAPRPRGTRDPRRRPRPGCCAPGWDPRAHVRRHGQPRSERHHLAPARSRRRQTLRARSLERRRGPPRPRGGRAHGAPRIRLPQPPPPRAAGARSPDVLSPSAPDTMSGERGAVIVTGGSRGIGAATCRLAAERGFSVCVNYRRDEAAAAEVVRSIEAGGGRALAVRADVSVEADVVRLFETADRELGALSAL